MRSRSAETVDSEADALQPMMETVASERHLPAPRSRLSTNLQQLETSRAVPEYNLQYFERSLMKSKETTLWTLVLPLHCHNTINIIVYIKILLKFAIYKKIITLVDNLLENLEEQ